MSLEQQDEEKAVLNSAKRFEDLHKWLKANPELEKTEKMYRYAKLLGVEPDAAALLADAFAGRLSVFSAKHPGKPTT